MPSGHQIIENRGPCPLPRSWVSSGRVMGDKVDDAEDLIRQADQYKTKKSFLGWFDNRNREKAIELYKQAHTKLVIQHEYDRAGDVAVNVAELIELAATDSGDDYGSREYYGKAASAYYKKRDKQAAKAKAKAKAKKKNTKRKAT